MSKEVYTQMTQGTVHELKVNHIFFIKLKIIMKHLPLTSLIWWAHADESHFNYSFLRFFS